MSHVKTAGDFWDRELTEPIHTTGWMEDLRVRRRINRMIGGDESLWPIEWLERETGHRTFERALSIGCGTGVLERQLIERGIAKSVDAFDGSPASIRIARRAADEAGFGDRIRYFVADFNRSALPRDRYDLVLFHQSLHHVGKLERLFRDVLRAMKRDGYLYLDEFIGPSRHEWDPKKLAPYDAMMHTLPRELRLVEKLPMPVQPEDPSEAIRSAEIVEQLTIGFRIQSMRGYGGNLLSVIYPFIAWRDAPDELVHRLMAEEDTILTSQSTFYAVILARPEQLPERRFYALARWFLQPKWKAVLAR
ncbi:MAG TPA: class I SAM-dependent methyltransferase, partial [Thermoanaerobaculia bacterium]|nr:class I SAM-dependent methyltransferase [Thermoanaerobaculia bacterium]